MNNKLDKNELFLILTRIEKGKVTTYSHLASMLGNKKWARAVGNALHTNSDGDAYPCYKVVDSLGRLSRAYAFGGIDEQKRRLVSDGVEVRDYTVDLNKYGWIDEEENER